MSSGPRNVTTTSNSNAQITPGNAGRVNFASDEAFRRFFDNQNFNTTGSDLTDQATGLLGRTIGGEFLDPSTNPNLQNTFNRAADLTRTRLSSEFAGSGRNIGASLPARSDELQTLASNIFGNNFENERQRQNSAITTAGGFNPITNPLDQLITRLNTLSPNTGKTITESGSGTQPVQRDGFGQILGGGLGLLGAIL